MKYWERMITSRDLMQLLIHVEHIVNRLMKEVTAERIFKLKISTR